MNEAVGKGKPTRSHFGATGPNLWTGHPVLPNVTIEPPPGGELYHRRRAEAETGNTGAGSKREGVEGEGKRVTVREIPDEFDRGGTVDFTMRLSVQVEGQEVYRHHMLSGGATFPLYYLGNWDDRWVVEANGMLIVDGEIVNQAWGYDEIFGSRLLNGQPFYFGVRDGQTYLVYDGRPLPVKYDQVYHGMCCEPGAFNVSGNEQMVWFYALRDGIWYYVEMGAYP